MDNSRAGVSSRGFGEWLRLRDQVNTGWSGRHKDEEEKNRKERDRSDSDATDDCHSRMFPTACCLKRNILQNFARMLR